MRDTIIVTGSRDFTDYRALDEVLLNYYNDPFHVDRLVESGARGADALAKRFAERFGMVSMSYPVDPKLDGSWPWAGHRRNERMLFAERDRCVCVVAFTSLANGDLTNGTADCVRKAEAMGLQVVRVKP